MECVWYGTIDLQALTFSGMQKDVENWANNLVGQPIKVIGKDGTEYSVGLVNGWSMKRECPGS